MSTYMVKVTLQDVTNQDIYEELDMAMAAEDGYTYITDENEKIWALPPDIYEFDLDTNAEELLNIVKLIAAKIEKKHNLKKSPIMVIESDKIQFANLEELNDSDFEESH